MKNLALDNYGVLEMSSQDIIEIDGGFWRGVAQSICAYIIVEITEGLARPC